MRHQSEHSYTRDGARRRGMDDLQTLVCNLRLYAFVKKAISTSSSPGFSFSRRPTSLSVCVPVALCLSSLGLGLCLSLVARLHGGGVARVVTDMEQAGGLGT